MNPWRDTPRLTGSHVTLRPYDDADLDALVAAAADGDLAALFYTPVSALGDPAAFAATLRHAREAGRELQFVVEAPGGRVIGFTRLLRMNKSQRRVEIGGTWYAGSVQRTGVNTEAKLLLLAYAFDTLGCNVVELRTDWLNRASRAAIERLGAKQDGVLRAHAVLGGRVRDMVCYSITAPEWPGIRTNLQFLLARGETR